MKTLLNAAKMNTTLMRLAHQLVENHTDFSNAALIGIQPRGVYLGARIHEMLQTITGNASIRYGLLDNTFYRDDLSTSLKLPATTDIRFSIENLNVILLDDVLFTGRTIRAAIDALIDYGRPAKVELLTLIDRRFNRELPVHPDYTGYSVDTINTQKVKVRWREKDGTDEVLLLEQAELQQF